VLFEGDAPTAITVVGRDGACPGEGLAPAPGGGALRADCAGVIALDGEAPEARRVPLASVPLRGGGGTAWSGETWNVTLVYGPEEDGCPGLPGHVQVKLGARPMLRQNTWLHVTRVEIVTTGTRAWLVLEAGDRGEAYALDRSAARVAWTRPGVAPPACASP